MLNGVMVLVAAQAAATTQVPLEDALTRYTACVIHDAWLQKAFNPADVSAESSAAFCSNLLGPAVGELLYAAQGGGLEASKRVSAILEFNAKNEAMARRTLIESYERELQTAGQNGRPKPNTSAR